MAYRLQRTGDSVRDLLNAVENKTIYPDATQSAHGLLSTEDKIKLDNLNIQSGTTAYWNSRVGYIPPADAIIIYTDYKSYTQGAETITVPGIKIGSGNGYVQDLAFIDEKDSADFLSHITNTTMHTTSQEKLNWNNKLNVNDLQEVVNETLIFNRN